MIRMSFLAEQIPDRSKEIMSTASLDIENSSPGKSKVEEGWRRRRGSGETRAAVACLKWCREGGGEYGKEER